jgi:hypothetical protein
MAEDSPGQITEQAVAFGRTTTTLIRDPDHSDVVHNCYKRR